MLITQEDEVLFAFARKHGIELEDEPRGGRAIAKAYPDCHPIIRMLSMSRELSELFQ